MAPSIVTCGVRVLIWINRSGARADNSRARGSIRRCAFCNIGRRDIIEHMNTTVSGNKLATIRLFARSVR